MIKTMDHLNDKITRNLSPEERDRLNKEAVKNAKTVHGGKPTMGDVYLAKRDLFYEKYEKHEQSKSA